MRAAGSSVQGSWRTFYDRGRCMIDAEDEDAVSLIKGPSSSRKRFVLGSFSRVFVQMVFGPLLKEGSSSGSSKHARIGGL
jgi:hypothetical protein